MDKRTRGAWGAEWLRAKLAPLAGGPMRILVVDDYAPFCNSVRLMLHDHRVEVAAGGRQALEVLANDAAFDALLLDVNMPEVSGLDVYEFLQLRAPGASQRVIFVTGGATSPVVADLLGTLRNPQLDKPFREPELRALLAEMAEAR
jgi:two-component system, cell cycle sensor histidine kinase and response regulator CckA